ncbi:type II toxin-antitoxin system HicA family toxin [Sulfurimonas sp. HSL1-6]|uniref:type II toxin-antitoxin system HicA family toxin n=1 Tax=Thiomicrolovo immobilis TaxID=3131935 RepID=UPI0031F890BA
MSKKDKLTAKFFEIPPSKSLTWKELEAFLKFFGFDSFNSKKGSSKVKFYNKEYDLFVSLHRPHPENTLLRYMVDEAREIVIRKLELEKLKNEKAE